MRHMATGSKAPDALLQHDWLGACRRAADGLQSVLRDHPTSTQRVIETGERGEGGDLTLVIDAAAEDAVFSELQRLHDDGARFTAVSEERGFVDFGDPGVLVVIDPIDGSMNAKRGLTHHALSVAVALCQVAATRVDGMATLWNCRAVDAAAGQLVVRESGGMVAFTACPDPLGAPLDLEPRSPVVASRTEAALAELATLPASDLEGTTYS